MDPTLLAILLATIPAASVIVSQGVQQYLGNVRAKDDHTHELRRDQQGKYYDFLLEEYRVRRDACESLMLAVHYMNAMLGTVQRVKEMQSRPITTEIKAAIDAETEAFNANYDRIMSNIDQPLKTLTVDERATPVMDAYWALPLTQLLKSPLDEALRQEWERTRAELKQAVYTYVGVLRDSLVPPPAKVDAKAIGIPAHSLAAPARS